MPVRQLHCLVRPYCLVRTERSSRIADSSQPSQSCQLQWLWPAGSSGLVCWNGHTSATIRSANYTYSLIEANYARQMDRSAFPNTVAHNQPTATNRNLYFGASDSEPGKPSTPKFTVNVGVSRDWITFAKTRLLFWTRPCYISRGSEWGAFLSPRITFLLDGDRSPYNHTFG